MKLKIILQKIIVNNFVWQFTKPFVYIFKRVELSRKNFLDRHIEAKNIALCNALFTEKKILHGIFKGLNWGNTKATGSSDYAKLLGSYEFEIQDELTSLLNNNYAYIINIGCDEGYYAVGLAIKLPNTKVIAFDCNKKAQENCFALAQLNNVSQQIIIRGCFNNEDLHDIKANERALFIIDCEGCESDINYSVLLNNFVNADFIIELHFEQNPMIAEKLTTIFNKTHNLKLINAISDYEKVKQYHYKEIEDLTYEQKYFILNERSGFMQWMIAIKNNN